MTVIMYLDAAVGQKDAGGILKCSFNAPLKLQSGSIGRQCVCRRHMSFILIDSR